MARRLASAFITAVLLFVPVSPLISSLFDSGMDMPCCKVMRGRCCHHSKSPAEGAGWAAGATCPNQCGQAPAKESGFEFSVVADDGPALIFVAAGEAATFETPEVAFAYDAARYQRPPPIA